MLPIISIKMIQSGQSRETLLVNRLATCDITSEEDTDVCLFSIVILNDSFACIFFPKSLDAFTIFSILVGKTISIGKILRM